MRNDLGYDEDALCDLCGHRGAFDFYKNKSVFSGHFIGFSGYFICGKCIENLSNPPDPEVVKLAKELVGGDEMKNPTVIQMVEAYLREHGYDGLYNEDGECACQVDDLFPCGDGYDAAGCCAGYRRPAPKSSDYDFLVAPEKWTRGICPECGNKCPPAATECCACGVVWT